MANIVDPDQTASLKQSDLGLHCLPRSACLKTCDHYGNKTVLPRTNLLKSRSFMLFDAMDNGKVNAGSSFVQTF